MKYKPKIIITISSFCALTGVLLVFLYSLTDPATRFRQKRTDLYIEMYNAALDSCEKWDGTFNYKIDSTFLSNYDTNFVYQAILIERYRTYEQKNLCDIHCEPIVTYGNAHKDAEYDFLKSKYGKDFKNTARIISRELNAKYKIHYYDTLLTHLAKEAYSKRMTKNTIEIGVFDKTFLDTIPFIVRVDTSTIFSFKEWFSIVETKNKIIFKATHASYNDSTKYLLPRILIYFYFDPQKTDFPYSKYSFKEIELDGI